MNSSSAGAATKILEGQGLRSSRPPTPARGSSGGEVGVHRDPARPEDSGHGRPRVPRRAPQAGAHDAGNRDHRVPDHRIGGGRDAAGRGRLRAQALHPSRGITAAVTRLRAGARSPLAPVAATPPGAAPANAPAPAAAPRSAAAPWAPPAPRCGSWARAGWPSARTAPSRVGAFLSGAQLRATNRVVLPSPGDTLQRGLPLAALWRAAGAPEIVYAPVSGEVIEVNEVRSGPRRRPGRSVRRRLAGPRPPEPPRGGARRDRAAAHVLVASGDDLVLPSTCAAHGARLQGARAHTADEVLDRLREHGPRRCWSSAGRLGDQGPALVAGAQRACPS